jgi:hypothetical protein
MCSAKMPLFIADLSAFRYTAYDMSGGKSCVVGASGWLPLSTRELSVAMSNDGFGQKLFGNITDNNGFRDEGILMVAKRRVSQADNSVLCNANNTYPRRVIIRSVGEDGSTHASRLAILRALQAFLVRTDNNRFGYAYVVNDESDLTPTLEKDLEPMDHYIHDMLIVNLMCSVLEETGSGWYAANSDSALDFFSGPTFPPYAIEQLGYPASGINGGTLPVQDGA